ncbi:uncharacterized protein LOC9648725 [Selaginella moellendorffii]|uniref:uncharacterized protein LOC9648725 n=1 Tax=Selaginella moellendorffii TaxID=88036 RepID=UPI000D1C39C2|nr:uncharacterized protein LOC9648725 [Selaginella moellendorffii]|eukprot:XP_024545659.1 uncharacterized protein LOC9648725 [Selaginella moellendorffii]
MHGVIAFYKDTTRILVNTLGFQSYGGTRLGGMFCQKSWRSRVFLTFSFREGQVWTSMSKMRLQFRNGIKKHEPQVFEIITFPKFGIGQRAFLIQTQAQTLDGARLLEASWFIPTNEWFTSTKRLSSTMGGTHAFSHFAVAQILHWSHGAQGRGVLFTGDILQVGMDNKTVGMDNKTVGMDNKIVSIMRSYLNYIPLLSSHTNRPGDRAMGFWEALRCVSGQTG